MMNPEITILMSVYNEEEYLQKAINSILNQTFTNFEFIIIDDGSIDDSLKDIRSFSDTRIKVISNKKNLGLADSLNKGITLATGKYIARMDADDIAHSNRLAIQFNFLEKHPEVGILGSFCQLFDDKSDKIGVFLVPIFDLAIRWTSLLNCPFAHPSVMMRRHLLIEHNLRYDGQFKATEDYNLWTELLKYTKSFNLNYPLVRYRLRNGITNSKRQQQLKEHDFIAHRTIRTTLPDFSITPEQVTLMRSLLITENFFDETGILKVDKLKEAIAIYLSMLSAFLNTYATHPEKNRLKRQEIHKITRLLLRLSKRSGFNNVLAPHLQQLTQLLWR
ncbi:glycosyltransferase family 2 protein [Aphanothece hegewaldii CCALA 016]|uniref:Glycosyltransferase family 2 protein n=1 Tax=Aphanothece hegewaldii CCALA 016 TaxID=2107694 RepID=A0A2T1LX51_9CHRO|nr:glycosyltransferase [Aphanothece hegewaldii]PSF36748.1 glycosyltransferase family 2 protein [Aphanothece hegewaldii CCALA 016]